LGGNDPAYVRGDADIEAAVETLVDAAIFRSAVAGRLDEHAPPPSPDV
jgi:hypothetical protein